MGNLSRSRSLIFVAMLASGPFHSSPSKASAGSPAAQDNATYCASLGMQRGSNDHAQCVINLNSAATATPRQNAPAPIVSSQTRPSDKPDQESIAQSEIFKKALAEARKGDHKVQWFVGRLYATGRGTQVDLTKSVYWYNESIKGDNPDAYYSLSAAYLQGRGVPVDMQKAFDYAQSAIKFGRADAAEIFKHIKVIGGENRFTCMNYGFRQDTSEFAQCLFQLDQAQRQAEIARQQQEATQRQLDFQRVQLEQERLAAAEARRIADEAIKAAERQRVSDALLRLSEDLRCPKKTPGFFAEPVAGCGRNKNQPVPQTINVRIWDY